MNSIDQKVVEMKFDNSQFESAVSQTMSTLEKFKEKLNFKGSEKGLNNLSKSTSDYQYTLQDVGESLANLEKRFGVVGTVGARIFEKLTDSAYGFVTKGIGNIVSSITQGGMSRAMNLEQARFQMQGIVNDAERVHEVIYDEILPQLQGTPFSLDQAAVVIGQIMASGKKSTEEIKTATKAISGVAAMTNSDFASIGNIFAKVAGNGRVMGDTLQQLSSRGLNAAADLTRFFNGVNENAISASESTTRAIKEITGGLEITEQQLREFVSDKDITISYDMFAEAMSNLYGSQAQKSVQMYTGALEDLKAALARVGAEPAALRLNFLRDAFNALVPAVDAVNAVIKPFWSSARSSAEAYKELDEYLKPFEAPIAKRVQEAGWAFQRLFVKLDENNAIVRATRDSYKDLGFELRESDKGVVTFWDDVNKIEYDEKQAIMNPKMLRLITASTHSLVNVVTALGKVIFAVGKGIRAAFPRIRLSMIADLAEYIQDFTSKLILSEESLNRIKWITRGVFTPLGLAVRAATSIIGLFARALRVALKVVSPFVSVVTSFFGMIGHIVAGLGNTINNFASILSGTIGKATESFRKATIWTTILTKIESICHSLAFKFDEVGLKAFKFLSHLHEVPAVQASLSTMSGVVERLHKAFSYVSSAVGVFIDKLDLSGRITALFDKISAFLSSKSGDITGSLGKFGGWIGKFSFYKSAIDLLTGSFTGLIGVLGGLSKYKPLKGIRKFFSELGGIIIDVGKSFVEGDFFFDRAKDAFKWFDTYRKTMGQFIKGVFPAIKAFAGNIPQIFNFKSWGAVLDSISKHIASAVSFILNTLGLFGSGVAHDAAKGIQNLGKVTEGIQTSAKNLASNQYLEPLKYFFDKISKSFKEWTTDMSPEKAKRLVLALAYFGTCIYYLSTITQAARAFRGLTKLANSIGSIAGSFAKSIGLLVNSISGIFSALKGAARAVSMVVYMQALATALIGIAAAMFIISRIDPKRLAAAAGITAGALIAITGIMVALNFLAKKLGPETSKSLLMLAGVIASIGFSMLAIAGAIKILTDLDQDKLGHSVDAVLSIVVVFAIMMGVMNSLPEMTANISKGAWALVGIAAGCRAIAEAIKMLAEIDASEEDVDRAFKMIEKLILMSGVFSLLGGWGKHGFGNGFGIIGVALGIKLIVGAIMDLATGLNAAQFKRAMTALKDIEKLILSFGGLMLAMGILNALSGKLNITGGASGFLFSGGKGGGALAIAEVIAGIWIIAKAVSDLGQLSDSQIDNGLRVLESFLTIIAVISLVSALGGYKVAAGAGAFAAVAAGLFLMAEGIVALGSTEHFLAGFIRMIITFIGLIGGVMLASAAITRLADTMISLKGAGAIALLSAAMLGFAISIQMIASLPIEGVIVAVIGLVAIMGIAAGVMAVFAGASIGLLPIAGVLALFGAATLFVGAGIFLLTLALSALIPLILGLANADMDQLGQGLQVLAVAAQGLAKVFDIMSGAAIRLAGAMALLGVGFLLVGVGALAIGVGLSAAAVGVFLLAGSFIVLYEVLSAFFPSVVQPVEEGMSSLADLIAAEFTRSADATRNGIQETGNAAEEAMNSVGIETTSTAEENSQNTAEAMNPFNYFSMSDMDSDTQAYIEQFGGIPGVAGTEWTNNEDLLLNPIENTTLSADEIMSTWSQGGTEDGMSYMTNLSTGITSSSDAPISALEMLFPGLKKVHDKMDEMNLRAGRGQALKMGEGIDSAQNEVKTAASNLAEKAVPPSKYEEGKSVGKGIGDGIIAGLKSTSSVVYDIAYSVAAKAAQGAKDGAAVNSPSKKTIPVGSSIGEGLIVGMKNIASKVVTASKDLASESIDALTEAMMSASSVFDSDLDYTPTITPVVDLTNVSQGANEINNMFGRDFGIDSMHAGGRNAALAAMGFRNQNDRNSELNKLVNSLDTMTDTMNSRSLNNYINIDGATDPEAFADGLIRSFRLNARTV